jgi:hypothetical protein
VVVELSSSCGRGNMIRFWNQPRIYEPGSQVRRGAPRLTAIAAGSRSLLRTALLQRDDDDEADMEDDEDENVSRAAKEVLSVAWAWSGVTGCVGNPTRADAPRCSAPRAPDSSMPPPENAIPSSHCRIRTTGLQQVEGATRGSAPPPQPPPCPPRHPPPPHPSCPPPPPPTAAMAMVSKHAMWLFSGFLEMFGPLRPHSLRTTRRSPRGARVRRAEWLGLWRRAFPR